MTTNTRLNAHGAPNQPDMDGKIGARRLACLDLAAWLSCTGASTST